MVGLFIEYGKNTSTIPYSISLFLVRLEETKWRSTDEVIAWNKKMHGELGSTGCLASL